MTSRERITAAFGHVGPDRTPIFEYVLLSPLADAFLGRTYSADPANWAGVIEALGWEPAIRRMARDVVELAQRLGHDMIYAIPNPAPPRPPTPPAAPGPPAPDDPVHRMEMRNAAARGWDPTPSDDNLLVYRLIRQEMDRVGLDLPMLAPAYAHGVWTDTDLMQCMALAPEIAAEHFQLATRGSLAAARKYMAMGIEIIGVGGDFAGNRPIISPVAYRRFIVPEVRRVADAVRQGGAWSVNASDGDLWSVIDDFLLGCGVDGYLEIDWGAGMDLARLKERYGRRITFVGNLDCGNVLSFGTPEQVREHTLACLRAGEGEGGHILCASNAITQSVPMANYLAAVNAYRDLFSLPRLCV